MRIPSSLAPLALLIGLSSLPAAGQSAAPPASVQIAAAVAPLPEEFRDGATVLGYQAGRAGLAKLRHGDGLFVCLADDPAEERFHVACYHRSLEPFMARGRELRAGGMTPPAADSARSAEIAAGRLAMPPHPAALYSLTGTAANLDAASGAVSGARALHVVYIPFATPESTGLSGVPARGTPWLMFPGTPKAHIMFVPQMQ